MAHHAEDGVIVITDTLATTVDGESRCLVTKCAVVPHLSMVIAGTGIAQLSARWVALVMESMLCRDIDMLDRHAPTAIRDLWAELDRTGIPTQTSTVYHFGLSEDRGHYVGYAYRSDEDFESEPLEPGFRVKPQPRSMGNAPQSLEELVAMACEIRSEQDARPAAERIYIGGDLVLVSMQNGGITTGKIHRWDDFESMWLTMNARLEEPNFLGDASGI